LIAMSKYSLASAMDGQFVTMLRMIFINNFYF
jgi:hypothetical protein